MKRNNLATRSNTVRIILVVATAVAMAAGNGNTNPRMQNFRHKALEISVEVA